MADYKMHILVCGGTGCRASQAEQIVKNFKQELAQKSLDKEIKVVTTGCFGFCEKGPVVKIIPDNTFYTQVTPQDVTDIVEEHFIKGRPLKRLLYHNPKNELPSRPR